jgi:hypothetical protein
LQRPEGAILESYETVCARRWRHRCNTMFSANMRLSRCRYLEHEHADWVPREGLR